MFAGSPAALPRPRLLDALSAPAAVVTLLGPIGSGATTALRQWAATRDDVTWAIGGDIPDTATGALIIDDAETLTAADWERVRALRAARPRMLVRLAAHTTTAIPLAGAEFVRDLSFTPAETAEYLASVASTLEAAAVHRTTGGLPAAVAAVAGLASLRHAVVDDVLAGLAPGTLPADDTLLAVPETITRALVAELGLDADVIDRAEAAGHGAWTSDAGHPLFTLTAPVRAATRRAHPTDLAGAVRERAGRVLLREGAWYAALREGAAAHSLEIVDAALKGGGLPLIGAHGASIREALRDVRPLEMRRWPVIAMAVALILNARHEHRMLAAELLGIALLGARSAPAGSAERALLRVIESAVRRLRGIGDGGVKAAQAAAHLIDELPDDERRSIDGLLGDLHIHAAISLMYGADGAAAEQFEKALAVARRPNTRLLAYGGIAMMNTLAGDLVSARRWIDTAFARPWPDTVLNEYQGSMLRIAQAWMLLENDDLDAAETAVDSVWHIIDTIEHWPVIAHVRATIDICRGHAHEGLERVQALRRLRGRHMPRSQARMLDLTESSLRLAAGDVAGARALGIRSGDLPRVTIGAARVEVFDGDLGKALRMLGTLTAHTPADRAAAAALEAVVLARLGRDPAGPAQRARAIADAHGLRTPFLLLPADARHLFDDLMPWLVDPADSGEARVPRLTARELVILGELVETASVNDIAARLHVSANTVKSQRRTLYRKLGAASRDEALAIATEHGILSSGVPPQR